MRSLSTFKGKRKVGARGFTLIETLVVMSLIAVIGGFTAFMTLDSYRSFAFRNDRDSLVAAIHRARSQSMANMCFGAGCTEGKPHGVHIESSAYTLFQGATYASRDASVDEVVLPAYSTSISGGSLSDVVFSQLSGDVASPGTITIVDGTGHSSTISINGEGRVAWTN